MRSRSLAVIVVVLAALPACQPRTIDVGGDSTTGELVGTADVPTTGSTSGEPCDPQGNAEHMSPDGTPCKEGFECQPKKNKPDEFVCKKPKT